MEERAAYTKRLLDRVFAVGATIGPVTAEFWEEMIPADEVLIEAVDAYEQGVIDKAEVDSKAVGYLNHWRGLCKK